MTVIRPPAAQRLAAVGALSVVGVAVVAGGVADGGLVLVPAVLGGLVALVAAWRTALMRVELGGQVVVVNFFRTHVVPWSDVARFSYDGGAVLRCADGRRTTITAFTPPSGALPFVERSCRRAVTAMEEVRRRRSR